MNPPPVWIDADNTPGRPLKPFTIAAKGSADESTLQSVLFANPELLRPGDDAPLLIPLAREVDTLSMGVIDNLYVSTTGRLTLVETKLIKNPGAHREVITQLVGYAAAIARWNPAQLDAAVRKARGDNKDVDSVVAAAIPEAGARLAFHSRLARALPVADFDLLIVGDEISEQAHLAASSLAAHPSLRFRLSLVEMRLYRTGAGEWPWLVVPRIVEQVVPVERFVVRIEPSSEASRVAVTPAVQGVDNGDGGTEPAVSKKVAFADEEAFLNSTELRPGFSDRLRDFRDRWRAGGGESAHSRRLLRWYFTDARGVDHWPLNIGTSNVSPIAKVDEEYGISPDDFAVYRAAVARSLNVSTRVDAGKVKVSCESITADDFGVILDATLALLERWRAIR